MATRREVLKAIGIASGGLACAAFPATSAFAQRKFLALVRHAPSANMLRAEHFTYLGMARSPDNTGGAVEGQISHTPGTITGRYHDGDTLPHLLIPGPAYNANGLSDPQDLTELRIPALNTLATDANYATRLANAPHCTVVRSWGRGVVMSTPIVDEGVGNVRGVHYVGNQFGNASELMYVYSSLYDVNHQDPSVGATILNDDGTATKYGPWGVQDIGQQGSCAFLMPVPAAFQAAAGCGPIAVSGVRQGWNAAVAAWGANLAAITPCALSTPANARFTQFDLTQPNALDADGNPWGISDYKRLIFHDQGHPQARNTNVKQCNTHVGGDGYPCTATDVQDGTGFWGSGTNAPIENMNAGVWINGPTRQGVLFLGGQPETVSIANGFSEDYVYDGDDPNHCHYSYMPQSDAAADIGKCCHGQTLNPVWGATGPGCGSMVGRYWIYDPADLLQVALGHVAPYSLTPASEGIAHALGGGLPEILAEQTNRVGSTFTGAQWECIGGAWFDPVLKLLVVTQTAIYKTYCCDKLPVFHFFSVDC